MTRLRSALRAPLAFVMKIARVVPASVENSFADHCTQNAAGIAYRVLFSIAPLVIFLVAVVGIVLQDDALRKEVTDAIIAALPVSEAGGQDVTNAINALAEPTGALGLFSLLVFAWTASGMMASIRLGLETAMRVEAARPAVRAKIVDFVLVAGIGLIVLGSVFLTVLGDLLRNWLVEAVGAIGIGQNPLSDLLGGAAWFAISVLVLVGMYRFVPARGPGGGDALVGAVVGGILFAGISLASGFIYGKATSLSSIYGPLTTIFVFLYSVYLYAWALLLGAEVAAAWSRPMIANPTPLLVQIRTAIIGLFVRRPPPGAEVGAEDERTR